MGLDRDVNDWMAAPGGRDSRAFESDSLSVVKIPVRNGPISDIDISPDGSRLIVTNYGGDSVSVIDTDTYRVLETVADVDEPFAIAIGNANRAYVTTVSTAYDSIEVIDLFTNVVVETHPLALSVSDLAVSACGNSVYASRNGARGADVTVLDTTTGKVEVIDLASGPGTTTECVRVSSDGSRLYVGANGPSGGQVVVIETRGQSDDGTADGRSGWRRRSAKRAEISARSPKVTQKGLRIVDTIDIGLPVRDVALSPDGGTAYVASFGPDVGAVLDVVDTRTNKITSTRKFGEIAGLLTRLTLSGDGTRAYLVSDDRITLVSTLTQDVIGAIRVANHPSCVVESRDGRYLYIADYAGAVTVAPIGKASGREHAALESNAHVEWTVQELPQYQSAQL